MDHHLVIKHLYKSFGKNEVLHDINLDIEKGLFTTFLGPSGCGKTTLLRTIAGFYEVERGDIYIGGKLINEVPTHLRNTTMVFQDYALFPHMSIRDNICFGLNVQKMEKNRIKERLEKTVSYLDIGSLLDRFPSQLLGGQQQRVALARALVMEPEVLLLDEPLSNLDAKLRMNIRAELRQLQKRLGITTIYVTHDQGEALALSDRIAVINQGRVQQYASSQDIYFTPNNEFTATFIGMSNLLSGTVNDDGHTIVLHTESKEQVRVKTEYLPGPGKLCFRPEMISIRAGYDGSENLFKGNIQHYIFEGAYVRYWIEAFGTVIIADQYDPGYRQILEGDVSIYLDPAKLHILQDDQQVE
jgi:ABC-type Fe3+/spermidine/putrescine transport system ATPase subunit